jgi:hypothetical protein
MQCSHEKFFAMLAMFAMQLIALLSALIKIASPTQLVIKIRSSRMAKN